MFKYISNIMLSINLISCINSREFIQQDIVNDIYNNKDLKEIESVNIESYKFYVDQLKFKTINLNSESDIVFVMKNIEEQLFANFIKIESFYKEKINMQIMQLNSRYKKLIVDRLYFVNNSFVNLKSLYNYFYGQYTEVINKLFYREQSYYQKKLIDYWNKLDLINLNINNMEKYLFKIYPKYYLKPVRLIRHISSNYNNFKLISSTLETIPEEY